MDKERTKKMTIEEIKDQFNKMNPKEDYRVCSSCAAGLFWVVRSQGRIWLCNSEIPDVTQGVVEGLSSLLNSSTEEEVYDQLGPSLQEVGDEDAGILLLLAHDFWSLTSSYLALGGYRALEKINSKENQ